MNACLCCGQNTLGIADASVGQCWLLLPSKWASFVITEVGFPLGVVFGPGSLTLISFRFHTPCNMKFLWDSVPPQDLRIIWLFKIVRSKRWRKDFLSICSCNSLLSSCSSSCCSQQQVQVSQCSHAYHRNFRGDWCIFVKMCLFHLSKS